MIAVDASAPARYPLWELGYGAVKRYLLEGTISVDHVVKGMASATRKHT